MTGSDNEKPAAPRGFALLSPEQRKLVAAKGGASIPADKRSFSVDRGLAKQAGKVGGTKSKYPSKVPDQD